MLYIARQPIFDLNQAVVGHELLFRSSTENGFGSADPQEASKQTVDTALMVGLDTLSDGKDIYLNCTSELILEGYAALMPPELAVIEVLETVQPTPALIAACLELKKKGYRVALDDFVDDQKFAPLVALADVIKVDFRATSPPACDAMVRKYGSSRTMLAEKVESDEEYQRARRSGFKLFQGYFFCRPKMLSTRNVPWSGETSFKVLRALSRKELNFLELEQLVKAEPALCYRLLRYLNSPAFYLETEVRSILHALTLLGDEKTRRWLLLVLAVMQAGKRNPALVHAAIMRARFAELLGPRLRVEPAEMFMLGLFSLLDAMLQIPMDTLLKQVHVPHTIAEALLGQPNPLAHGLHLVLAYESGDWQRCDELSSRIGVESAALRNAYLEAVIWAHDICGTAFSQAKS